MGRDRDLQSTVGADKGLGGLSTVRQGGLNKQPCHEAERTGLLRLLGLDRERLAEQLVGRALARDFGLRDSANG